MGLQSLIGIGNIHYIEHLFWIMNFARCIENNDSSVNFPESKVFDFIQAII